MPRRQITSGGDSLRKSRRLSRLRGPFIADPARGFTLVEMLVALSISLLVLAAVVSVFANVSQSVANQRATVEMTANLRQVRNLLQQDLAAATCPGIANQRPESAHGYIEIIEGPRCDFDPSDQLTDTDNNGVPDLALPSGETFDLTASLVPASNAARLPGATTPLPSGVVTDGGGLGDADDILMLTARNETRQYVGRIPASLANPFTGANAQQVQSPLAEVAWFAIENPVGGDRDYFGEPGFRTIYRRVLLIMPDVGRRVPGGDPRYPDVITTIALPRDSAPQALAALVAFQETYDLSVRLDWRPDIEGGQWALVANSLKDLTKRENRFEHHGVFPATSGNIPVDRRFPFPVASSGGLYSGNPALVLATAPGATGAGGAGQAIVGGHGFDGHISRYQVTSAGANYQTRPFVYVDQFLDRQAPRSTVATPRAIVNEDGAIVAFTNGLAPLGGARRGSDVVMTDVLAFDLRVFDPSAPVLASVNATAGTGLDRSNFPGTALAPSDRGWGAAVRDGGWRSTGAAAAPGQPTVLSRGAYVDPGYVRLHQSFLNRNTGVGNWSTAEEVTALLVEYSPLADRPKLKSQLRSGNVAAAIGFDPYRVYDTWSLHYENNGTDEDGDGIVDRGANGLNDPVNYGGAIGVASLYGPDDADELETLPPYEVRLRSVQATIRAYELDSRQIREVSVRQGYVPK